jgi:hypothetical protein
MTRTGLGRRRTIEERAGDPLDGLVNLFDVGMVLAVAFLIAGLGLTLDNARKAERVNAERGRVLPSPRAERRASGPGEAVGRVYRLPDGRLIFVPQSSGEKR